MIVKFLKKKIKFFLFIPFIFLIMLANIFKKIRFFKYDCEVMGAAEPIHSYLIEKNKKYLVFFYFTSFRTLKDLYKKNKNIFWLKILSREMCWIHLNNKFLFLLKNNIIFLFYKAVVFFKLKNFLINFKWIIGHTKDTPVDSKTRLAIQKIINSNLDPVIKLKKEEVDFCQEKIIPILKLNNEKREHVVFHNRDSAYKKIHSPNYDWSYHDYRNWDFDDYKKTLEYATKKYFTIRVGNIIEKPSKFKSKNFFEYANSNLVTDELDVYLIYSCKFYVGAGTGIDKVARLFNKPTLYINTFHPQVNPPRYLKKCIFLPTKLFDIKNNKLITFPQLFDKNFRKLKENFKPMGHYTSTTDYKNAGIKIIYNTPDDIFFAFQEMEKFIEGKLEFDSLDIKLSKNFWKLFPEEAINTKEVIISPSFLRKNQELLA